LASIDDLPRREREIYELLCSAKEATASAVRARMRDAPSHSAVRTLLGRLEARGLITHRVEEQSYVYAPTTQRTNVRRTAMRRFVDTFFEGSGVSAATELLGLSKTISAEELDELQRAIDKASERQ